MLGKPEARKLSLIHLLVGYHILLLVVYRKGYTVESSQLANGVAQGLLITGVVLVQIAAVILVTSCLRCYLKDLVPIVLTIVLTMAGAFLILIALTIHFSRTDGDTTGYTLHAIGSILAAIAGCLLIVEQLATEEDKSVAANVMEPHY